MKKFVQLVVTVTILASFISISYAWDVYVYNKTKHSVEVRVQQKTWKGEEQWVDTRLNPGTNEKFQTGGLFREYCATSGEARYEWGSGMEQMPWKRADDGSVKCRNLRLEITPGDSGALQVQWFTQF